MTRYRGALPQLSDRLFLTDGGLETTLIFLEGVELPDFAAFPLLGRPEGEEALRKYFRSYLALADRFDTGLILETATWRASSDWGRRLGVAPGSLAAANRRAVAMLEELREERGPRQPPVVISGCLGPRGDGYVPDRAMSAEEAEAYHREQIETFAETAADMVCALTMNYVEEAAGVARAAKHAGMPVAISFTVETDGSLPTGQDLGSAIEAVDAASGGHPAYYMVNCAHPSHFERSLEEDGSWRDRLRGFRANASRRSHAELNDSPDLDIGDPAEVGGDFARLKRALPRLTVMGGCCGTDDRHVGEIAKSCRGLFP